MSEATRMISVIQAAIEEERNRIFEALLSDEVVDAASSELCKTIQEPCKLTCDVIAIAALNAAVAKLRGE